MDDIFDLKPVRRVHRVALAELGFRGEHAFWCEWDHPDHPDERSLTDLMVAHARGWRWAEFIRPGDTCIDIGAHTGDSTIPMAACAYGGESNRGVVVAVEPNPDVRAVLDVNLALNGHLASFRIVASAITNEPMDAVEIADHGNRNCNGGIIHEDYSEELVQHLRQVAGTTITVPGEPLGAMCERVLTPEELGRLSFVKTDCEGYDKEIIRSSHDFLAAHRPTLFVEWFDYFRPEDSQDLFSVVEAAGYVAFDPATRERARPDAKIGDLLLLHRSRI